MRSISFFSGALGMDLGFEAAGCDVRLVAEINPAACATIRANRPHLPILPDVTRTDVASIRRLAGFRPKETIDVVYGGPPCQSFSSAGKRRGLQDARGSLLMDYVDLIVSLQPRFAVIENVAGILSAPLVHRPHAHRGKAYPPLSPEEQPGGVLREILLRLERGGYYVTYKLYNAANYGTPQKRARVILICSREAMPPYLIPTHAQVPVVGTLPWRTFRQAAEGLAEKEAEYVQFSEMKLHYYRILQEGQNWRNLPPELQPKALGGAFASGGGKTGFYRRLAWDKPAPTLMTRPTMPATALAHPVHHRPLSVQEYLRLQEFPDNWLLAGDLLDKYRQIGNAVPVGFASAIGRLVAGMASRNTAG